MYDLFYFVPGMWTFILVVCVINLFSRTNKLTEKIKKLETQISSFKPGESYKNSNDSVQIKSPVEGSYIIPPITPIQDPYVAPGLRIKVSPSQPLIDSNETSPIAEWFKENLLLKIGVIMILLGFGWFVSYAFMHNWIGPVGRITLGILTGTIITVIGTFRLNKDKTQGNALTILGTALVVITLLAGQYFYGFFAPSLVLALIFVVSLYVSMTAVAADEEKLAAYGMIVSIVAPFLSHTSSMNLVMLYMYVGVISVSAIWISITKNWRNILLLGMSGFALYALPNLMSGAIYHSDMKYILLFINYTISVIYMIVGIWSMVSNSNDTESNDMFTVLVNAILITGFTMSVVPNIFQSLTLAVWMIVYAITGFFVFSKTNKTKLFYAHSLIAVFLLALATSIELHGASLVIAFSIEAAIITVSAFLSTNSIKKAEVASTVLFVPVFMSLQSFSSSSWNRGVIHEDFFVLILLAIILALLGIFFKLNRSSNHDSDDLKVNQIYFIGSSIYVFALVWLCSQSIIRDSDSAVFLSLFIYTITGLATHFYGLFNHSAGLKKYGMTVLILVVVRLLLVDVWHMELLLRVITFIVLGAMFMSSAFISKSQNNLVK